MTQGALGQIVGQRQLGGVEHDPEGVSVVEQLTGKRVGLLVLGLGVLGTQVEQRIELLGMLFVQRYQERPFAGRVDGSHDRLDAGSRRIGNPIEPRLVWG